MTNFQFSISVLKYFDKPFLNTDKTVGDRYLLFSTHIRFKNLEIKEMDNDPYRVWCLIFDGIYMRRPKTRIERIPPVRRM
jgi:hypothetical protein